MWETELQTINYRAISDSTFAVLCCFLLLSETNKRKAHGCWLFKIKNKCTTQQENPRTNIKTRKRKNGSQRKSKSGERERERCRVEKGCDLTLNTYWRKRWSRKDKEEQRLDSHRLLSLCPSFVTFHFSWKWEREIITTINFICFLRPSRFLKSSSSSFTIFFLIFLSKKKTYVREKTLL